MQFADGRRLLILNKERCILNRGNTMSTVRMSKKKKRILIVAAVGVVALTLMLVFFFANLRNAPQFDVGAHSLTVTGEFPEDIPLDGAEVSLQSSVLEITDKLTGSHTGRRYQGNFIVSGIGDNVYLNLMDSGEEYIRIVNNGNYYFINRNSPRETQKLYQEILKRIQ